MNARLRFFGINRPVQYKDMPTSYVSSVSLVGDELRVL